MRIPETLELRENAIVYTAYGYEKRNGASDFWAKGKLEIDSESAPMIGRWANRPPFPSALAIPNRAQYYLESGKISH